MKRMTPMILGLAIVLVASAAPAAEILQEIRWSEKEPPLGATVVEDRDGAAVVRLSHDGTSPRSFPLARLDEPGIRSNQYVLTGEIRYEDVSPGSYLEMWNVFADGNRFFSRTLGTSGPLAQLTGSSDWRGFALPAFLQESPERPSRLEINLVLSGPGSVDIGPLVLSELAPGEDMLAVVAGEDSGWWSDRVGGWIGGLGGSGLGVLGALLGGLVALGRARGLVTGLAVVLLVGGIVALVLGILAVSGGQPYGVYYPLLLLGGMTVLFTMGLLVLVPRRWAALEMRRMRAMDAG